MRTQDNAVQAGAEVLVEHAKVLGQAAGLSGATEEVVMLERALAIAWANVFLYQGANPSRERMNETIRTMMQRIAAETRAQAILRAGHNPQG